MDLSFLELLNSGGRKEFNLPSSTFFTLFQNMIANLIAFGRK